MIKNISLFTLSGVLAKSCSLLILPMIAHSLSVEEFGDYILLVSVIMLIQSTFLFGFEHSLNYYFNKFRAEANKKILVSTQTLFILFVLVLFSILSNLIFSERIEHLNLILIWGNLSVFVAYFGTLLKVEMKVFVFLKSQVLQSLVLLLLVYLFLSKCFLALEGVLYANILALLASIIFIYFFIKRYLTLSFNISLLKKVLQYGLPLMPAGIMLWGSTQLDRYFILYFQDKYSLGIYAFALAVVMIPLFLKTAIKSAIDPFIMKAFHGRSPKTKSYITGYFSLSLFVFSSLFIFLSIFSKDIVFLIGGSKYLEAVPYIPWLLLIACLTTVNQYFIYGLNFKKSNSYIFKGLIFMLIINVTLIFVFIQSFSIFGVIFANLLANIFYTVYLYINSNKLYPLHHDVLSNALIIVSALVVVILDVIYFQEGYLYKILSIFIFIIFNKRIYVTLKDLLNEGN